MTIEHASELIKKGELSPIELLDSCLKVIDERDHEIRAWVILDREGALEQARTFEQQARDGNMQGPLHGIPLGIKDIIDVKGMPTRAGADFYHHEPVRDATIVERLRSAGAVIMGKTVTTQFACFDPSPTRNPHNLEHTPGGSSSGSAAAVASGMCLGALGSQTGGSITRPSAYCGITGLKGTHRRVSVHGVVPVSFNLDHPGPMANCVIDLAMLFQSIAGHDPHDPYSSRRPTGDYLSGLGAACDLRIGVISDYFHENADADMREALNRAENAFSENGSQIERFELPKSFDELHEMHQIIMCAEMTTFHAPIFARHRKEYSAGIQRLIEGGMSVSATDYANALRHQNRFRSEITEAMKEFDVLLTPSAPTTAPHDLTTTGNPMFNSPWSYSGLPTVGLPVHLAPNGLPTSVQLVGHHFQEADLLAAAKWCEEALQFREVNHV